jgi:hypothetical protein
MAVCGDALDSLARANASSPTSPLNDRAPVLKHWFRSPIEVMSW